MTARGGSKAIGAGILVFLFACAAGFAQELCGPWVQPCGPHKINWISTTADGPHESVNLPGGPSFAYPGLFSTDPVVWTDTARSIYNTNPFGYHLPNYATAALQASGLPNQWPPPTYLPTAAQRSQIYALARYFCSLPDWQYQNGMTQLTWATAINQYEGNAIVYPPPWTEPPTPTVPCSVIPQSGFMPLTPCRLLDTRNPDGPYGGPALTAGADRTFVLAGQCGIPATAIALAVNVAAVNPTDGPGYLTLYPGGSPLPLGSTLNYKAGKVRANNAIVPLGAFGDMTVRCQQGTGTTHIVIDVSGYFQ